VADYLQRTFADKKVILVSQDINLRMKAKSLGINAQDYKTGKVQNLDEIQKNIVVYEQVNDELIAKLYNHNGGIAVEEFEFARKPLANQYSILKGGSSSVLTHYDADKRLISRVEKQKAYGIGPRNAEQTFALDALLRPEIKLISLTGKAGTGKTLLALAAALQQRKDFQQILLARPIVSLSNRDLGFLPGDVKDKIEPYMQPLYDNLSVIKHQFSSSSSEFMKIEEMQRNEKLVITPLAYIRGRSLSNVYFIVDEAQNLTPHEIKTIITRAGEGTKMVFTGDIQQIDSPYLDEKSNGLTYLADKMRGQHVFAHMNLVKGERGFLADLAGDLL
jgi:PhoH-like ATPase